MTAYQILQQELRAEPRTWLITGVAGFIGSHLLETLLRLEQRVVGLDNFSTGTPRNLDDVAIHRTLSAPAPLRDGFHCVMADGLRAPFVNDAFDAVVAPWFVDIVDDDLGLLAKRINRLLRPGGQWVIFGSLRFSHADPALCYSVEEASALVLEGLLGRAG